LKHKKKKKGARKMIIEGRQELSGRPLVQALGLYLFVGNCEACARAYQFCVFHLISQQKRKPRMLWEGKE